jgi:hypothetical protein
MIIVNMVMEVVIIMTIITMDIMVVITNQSLISQKLMRSMEKENIHKK